MIGELVNAACPRCDGDGYTMSLNSQDLNGCEVCGTTGYIETCSACGEVPTVVAGNEACGCTFAGAFEDPEVVWAATFTDWLSEAA